jgi:hypothetical protein
MRISFAAALILALYPLAAWAQEKPAKAQSPAPSAWTKERIESPPKRDIKFERRTEKITRRLFRADPKLLELNTIASWSLLLPQPYPQPYYTVAPQTLKELPFRRWLEFYQGHLLSEVGRARGESSRPLQDSFQALIDAMPPDRRPNKEVVDLFTGPQIATRLSEGESDNSQNVAGKRRMRLELLAASPEEAEQATAALLEMLDWGASRRIQLEIVQQRDAATARVTEAQQKVEEYTHQIAPQAADVAELGSLSSEAAQAGLSTLHVQLLVERTGARARIEACERLAARDDLPQARRETLENERLKTEIDLASVEARLKAIQATWGMASAKGRLSSAKSTLRMFDFYLEQHAPPELDGGAVLIQPVQWQ